MTGSTMQNAAILWHVSLLVPSERRALALGVVGLVRVAPIVLLSLWSGAAADAVDRRRLMLATQTALGLVAATLAGLTLAGTVTVTTVYALAALGAAGGALDGPARQALVPALVPREDLPNAVGLNTIMFQTAAVAGPALAGGIIATLGVGATYALNAASFLAVIVALARMRGLPSPPPAEPGALGLGAVREGLRFVFGTPLIRSTMLLDGLATFFSSATALLPLFAQDVLVVGPTGYGWLYAAPSVGAFVASAAMVRQVDRIERRGAVLLWAVAAYGGATVAFGLSGRFWLSFLALAATGAADTVSMVLRGVIRQLETPDRLRGRMVGVNMVFFMGGPQLGELEAGLVAQWLGPVAAVVTGGLGCLAVTAWIAGATPVLRAHRAGR
jgi:MFS family permease